MYGKNYESMYEGSMIGAGIGVFAVWNYIITKGRGGAVEVNPKLLAFTLGGTEAEIVSALEFLQRPDPESRSKAEDGRRIIREGQFQYRIVNWDYYQVIKSASDKREYNKVKQAEYRAKKQSQPRKSRARQRAEGGEAAYLRAEYGGGSGAQLDSIVEESIDRV